MEILSGWMALCSDALPRSQQQVAAGRSSSAPPPFMPSPFPPCPRRRVVMWWRREPRGSGDEARRHGNAAPGRGRVPLLTSQSRDDAAGWRWWWRDVFFFFFVSVAFCKYKNKNTKKKNLPVGPLWFCRSKTKSSKNIRQQLNSTMEFFLTDCSS